MPQTRVRRTLGRLARDELGGEEDGRVEDDAREGEHAPHAEEAEAVAQERERAPAWPANAVDLVVLEPHVAQKRVVFAHAVLEVLNARVLLVSVVADDEALVELDDLAERQVLARRAVQATRRLDELWAGAATNERRWSMTVHGCE